MVYCPIYGFCYNNTLKIVSLNGYQVKKIKIDSCKMNNGNE